MRCTTTKVNHTTTTSTTGTPILNLDYSTTNSLLLHYYLSTTPLLILYYSPTRSDLDINSGVVGGVVTPAFLFGDLLIKQLNRSGIKFEKYDGRGGGVRSKM